MLIFILLFEEFDKILIKLKKFFGFKRNYYLMWIYDDFSFEINPEKKFHVRNYLKLSYERLYNMFLERINVLYSVNVIDGDWNKYYEMKGKLKKHELKIQKHCIKTNVPHVLLVCNFGKCNKVKAFEVFTGIKINVKYSSSLRVRQVNENEAEKYLNSLTKHEINGIKSFMYRAKYFENDTRLEQIILKHNLRLEYDDYIKDNVIDFSLYSK